MSLYKEEDTATTFPSFEIATLLLGVTELDTADAVEFPTAFVATTVKV